MGKYELAVRRDIILFVHYEGTYTIHRLNYYYLNHDFIKQSCKFFSSVLFFQNFIHISQGLFCVFSMFKSFDVLMLIKTMDIYLFIYSINIHFLNNEDIDIFNTGNGLRICTLTRKAYKFLSKMNTK